VTSASIRARLALVVLLSELFLVLAGAPNGARHQVHRATIDAVTSHAASARLPKATDARVSRADARETAACAIPAATPLIARAASERTSFTAALDHEVFTATFEPRARGPPAIA